MTASDSPSPAATWHCCQAALAGLTSLQGLYLVNTVHVASDDEGQLLVCTGSISLPLDGSIQGIWKAVLEQAEQITIGDTRIKTCDCILHTWRNECSTRLTRTLVGQIVPSPRERRMIRFGVVKIIRTGLTADYDRGPKTAQKGQKREHRL